jgi:type IV pilus assembly protein PilB
MKIGTEVDVVQALTCQYGFPYLPLANYEIAPEVVAAVPRGVCHQYCLVPIDKIGRSLTLTMANPLNVQALEDVEKVTGCSVQAFISTAADINRAINRYYETRKSGDKIAF